MATDARWTGRQIAKLTVRVQNGITVNDVRIAAADAHEKFTMQPNAQRTVTLSMPAGFPYRPYETPTSYVYVVSFSTTSGFAPFLKTPPSSDARFLGAQITLTPEFR